MNLLEPENKNYVAIVTRINDLQPLEGMDNVLAAGFYGYQALVSKDTKAGELGIVFPPEVQLSDEFVKNNNLYRHADKNKDQNQQGYIEDNRRVRAIKLRGHRSDCLFMPLSSLNYTGVDTSQLKEGDIFDKLGSQEICRKYIVKEPGVTRLDKNKKVRFSRVTNVEFPLHLDTDNYFRNKQNIPDDQWITVTQKVHGTSIRIGNIRVKRELKWYEKLAKKLGIAVTDEEYAHVYGSRRVIKDPENPKPGYYVDDIYTREGSKIKDKIPQDYVFFGELIGYVSGDTPIQKNYTYNVPVGQTDLYIYRIAHVSDGGRIMVDLSWDQTMQMCRELGLKHVPELWRGPHKEFNAEDWLDVRYFDMGYKNAVPLSGSKKLVDEGVVIRIERLVPYLTKAKSPAFLQMETKLLDKGEADLESVA